MLFNNRVYSYKDLDIYAENGVIHLVSVAERRVVDNPIVSHGKVRVLTGGDFGKFFQSDFFHIVHSPLFVFRFRFGSLSFVLGTV